MILHRLFFLSIIAFSTTCLHAQVTNFYNFGINNVATTVSDGGIYFNNLVNNSPSYEFPSGSGNHLIYSSAFWFGATDINGQIKMSAQMYEPGKDLFAGAITENTATSPNPPYAAGLHAVSKQEIDDHVANYTSTSYVIPSSILDWPAHGDVAQNLDYYLAPFVDTDGDGVYNPANGDYPKIRGDYAVYVIMNDKKNIHTGSGGDPLGIESHFMFYQYTSSDFLNNTTFVNIKVINRGTAAYSNFRVGCFVDPDVGEYSDDFVGCDSSKHLMYAYNADNLDIDYGNNPPALGVVDLHKSMETFGTFSNGIGADPNMAADYWNYMNGNWINGSPFTYGGAGTGGTVETNYLYSGNPNNAGEWSELDNGNASGDRRMYMSSNPVFLGPGDEICYDYAYIVGASGDHLQNVNELITIADQAVLFFESQTDFLCENYELTLSNLSRPEGESLKIYPVPTADAITVDISGTFDMQVFAIDGKLVLNETNLQGYQPFSLGLEAGTYIAVIKQGNSSYRNYITVM